MNIAIELVELEASPLISAVDGEPEEEFLSRVRDAEGKNLLVMRVIEGWQGDSPKQLSMQSPYFVAGDTKAKLALFDTAMKDLRRMLADRERANPTGAAKEKSRIIGG